MPEQGPEAETVFPAAVAFLFSSAVLSVSYPVSGCRVFQLLFHQSHGRKICQNNHTKNNAVISEKLEVVFPDISHQKLNGINRYKKCYHHTENQIEYLDSCEIKTEFQHFQKACAKHHRNSQEKGKLCCHTTGTAQNHGAENRCSGT